eukprot:1151849-Pelagomonas_calceolata.AAC.7
MNLLLYGDALHPGGAPMKLRTVPICLQKMTLLAGKFTPSESVGVQQRTETAPQLNACSTRCFSSLASPVRLERQERAQEG